MCVLLLGTSISDITWAWNSCSPSPASASVARPAKPSPTPALPPLLAATPAEELGLLQAVLESTTAFEESAHPSGTEAAAAAAAEAGAAAAGAAGPSTAEQQQRAAQPTTNYDKVCEHLMCGFGRHQLFRP